MLRPPEGGLDALEKFVWHPDGRGSGRRLRPGITFSQHADTLRIREKTVKRFLTPRNPNCPARRRQRSSNAGKFVAQILRISVLEPRPGERIRPPDNFY